MITIELSPDEQAALIEMLETCITDMHSEIRRTSSHDYKEDLKKRRDILVKLYNQLQHSYQLTR